MTGEISFTIPGKVPAKSSSRRVFRCRDGRTRVVSSEEAVAYEEDFGLYLKPKHKVLSGYNGSLHVRFVVYAESRRQDLDSYSKILLDAMQRHEVIKNDNRVEELYLKRFIDKDNPRVEITLWPTGEGRRR